MLLCGIVDKKTC